MALAGCRCVLLLPLFIFNFHPLNYNNQKQANVYKRERKPLTDLLVLSSISIYLFLSLSPSQLFAHWFASLVCVIFYCCCCTLSGRAILYVVVFFFRSIFRFLFESPCQISNVTSLTGPFDTHSDLRQCTVFEIINSHAAGVVCAHTLHTTRNLNRAGFGIYTTVRHFKCVMECPINEFEGTVFVSDSNAVLLPFVRCKHVSVYILLHFLFFFLLMHLISL